MQQLQFNQTHCFVCQCEQFFSSHHSSLFARPSTCSEPFLFATYWRPKQVTSDPNRHHAVEAFGSSDHPPPSHRSRRSLRAVPGRPDRVDPGELEGSTRRPFNGGGNGAWNLDPARSCNTSFSRLHILAKTRPVSGCLDIQWAAVALFGTAFLWKKQQEAAGIGGKTHDIRLNINIVNGFW